MLGIEPLPLLSMTFEMVHSSFLQCIIFIHTATGSRSRNVLIISFSLTHSLTTTQPPYLCNLISVQHPRSTRSSSLVTLACPPASSSLQSTDRSFRYASTYLWNQLPVPLRQPCTSLPLTFLFVYLSSPLPSWIQHLHHP